MKRFIIVLVLLSVMLYGCANIVGSNSRDTSDNNGNNNSVTSKADNVNEPVIKESDIVGTYVGLHGSGITFLGDGTAEYFWKEWSDVEVGDKWNFDGKRITMRSNSLRYDIYADVSGSIVASLTFQSSDTSWSDDIAPNRTEAAIG